jgi:nitroimidazol reductase NimA-like FMN-containing flavoprotein (pyridoxamine 5'-phosphate oxidase superfamily)
MRKKELQVTELSEIEDILGKAEVCRISFADNNIPYIVTLNFGYSGNPVSRLFFHCAPEGRKLEMMKKNNYVCFEADTDHMIERREKPCKWSMHYRSVVGYGRISAVSDAGTRKEGMNSIMKHYGGGTDPVYDDAVFARTVILMLEIEEMTGKKC